MMSRYLLAFVVLLLVSGPSIAGEISYANGKPHWVSTHCPKPLPPGMEKGDSARLNRSVLDLETYINAVNDYNGCLKTEAEQDMADLNKVIVRDVAISQNTAIDEAERARSNFVRRR